MTACAYFRISCLFIATSFGLTHLSAQLDIWPLLVLSLGSVIIGSHAFMNGLKMIS